MKYHERARADETGRRMDLDLTALMGLALAQSTRRRAAAALQTDRKFVTKSSDKKVINKKNLKKIVEKVT